MLSHCMAPSFALWCIHRIDLPHVSGGDPNKPVYLEVLSVSPAVFDLHNFFSKVRPMVQPSCPCIVSIFHPCNPKDESAELIERALDEKKESHRIKRSSTGDSGYTLNDRRTSESGYDTDGATSMRVKKCVHAFVWQVAAPDPHTSLLQPLF